METRGDRKPNEHILHSYKGCTSSCRPEKKKKAHVYTNGIPSKWLTLLKRGKGSLVSQKWETTNRVPTTLKRMIRFCEQSSLIYH